MLNKMVEQIRDAKTDKDIKRDFMRCLYYNTNRLKSKRTIWYIY